MTTPHFTEPTTAYWQQILPATAAGPADGPWQYGYPARLPDGRVLVLPIRQMAGQPDLLAERLAPLRPEVVVGVPTLGLSFAPIVARRLGLSRMVPLGYSRKFWYDEALSGAVQSITTPTAGKRVYLDPNLLPLVRGRRVVLVDDAVSSGSTIAAPWNLLEAAGATVLGVGVAMCQGRRWAEVLGPQRAARVFGVFDSPLLQAVPQGWIRRL